MELSQCSVCGLVRYVGPTVSYFKKAIRSNKLSRIDKFRAQQFQEFLNLSPQPIKSVFELGTGQESTLIFLGVWVSIQPVWRVMPNHVRYVCPKVWSTMVLSALLKYSI